MKANMLIAFRGPALQPILIGKVVSLLKFQGVAWVRLHYYGDGADGFLNKYLPLDYPTGSKKNYHDLMPLNSEVEANNIMLLDWNFTLKQSRPKYTLRIDTVKGLLLDIRNQEDAEHPILQGEYLEAAKKYLDSSGKKRKRGAGS